MDPAALVDHVARLCADTPAQCWLRRVRINTCAWCLAPLRPCAPIDKPLVLQMGRLCQKCYTAQERVR